MTDIACVLPARAELGESPVWCARTARLWWVDIRGERLHRFDPAAGADEVWPLPEPAGCLALGADGRIVLALASGLAWFDPGDAAVTPFLAIEADDPATRLNDGRVDRQGRLFVGSMARAGGGAVGTLYRADAEGGLAVMRRAITVPNCAAFSPDGRRMYFADSPTRQIVVSALDPATGDLGAPVPFATVPRGVPDGGTVDAEGHLWVALWDGAAIARYRPDGSLATLIDLPVRRPTCPAFGGADLGTLYVTSARTGLDAPGAADGGILAFRPGVVGMLEAFFGSK